MVLVKYDRALGIDAYGKQKCNHVRARGRELLGVLRQRERMPADDGEQQLVFGSCLRLQLGPVRKRAKIVAKLQAAPSATRGRE
jgi:hypothetical protein